MASAEPAYPRVGAAALLALTVACGGQTTDGTGSDAATAQTNRTTAAPTATEYLAGGIGPAWETGGGAPLAGEPEESYGGLPTGGFGGYPPGGDGGGPNGWELAGGGMGGGGMGGMATGGDDLPPLAGDVVGPWEPTGGDGFDEGGSEGE